MTPEELKSEFAALYNMMATSHNPDFMRTFGNVHKEMMSWFIANKPSEAQEWIEKLSAIRWNNFLTQKEAQTIVDNMQPSAPWTRDQWKAAMKQHDFPLEKEPCYNSCALWVTMNMLMSDSSETMKKYVDEDNLFNMVYDLAIDKLTDKDKVFHIRDYFHV